MRLILIIFMCLNLGFCNISNAETTDCKEYPYVLFSTKVPCCACNLTSCFQLTDLPQVTAKDFDNQIKFISFLKERENELQSDTMLLSVLVPVLNYMLSKQATTEGLKKDQIPRNKTDQLLQLFDKALELKTLSVSETRIHTEFLNVRIFNVSTDIQGVAIDTGGIVYCYDQIQCSNKTGVLFNENLLQHLKSIPLPYALAVAFFHDDLFFRDNTSDYASVLSNIIFKVTTGYNNVINKYFKVSIKLSFEKSNVKYVCAEWKYNATGAPGNWQLFDNAKYTIHDTLECHFNTSGYFGILQLKKSKYSFIANEINRVKEIESTVDEIEMVESVVPIFNDIVDEVDTDELRKHQKEYNVTDEILDLLDIAVERGVSKSNETFTYDSKCLKIRGFDTKSENHGVVLNNEGQIYFTNDTKYVEKGGVIIDAKLMKQIADNKSDKIAVTTFLNQHLFNDFTNNDVEVAANVVYGILIPGYIKTAFEVPIKTYIKIENVDEHCSYICAYWDYGTGKRGSWKYDHQAHIINGTYLECQYNHVTHFAMLISDKVYSCYTENIFDILTIIGCTLSIIGFLGIYITAAIFKEWRSNKGNIILLNYVSITFFIIMFMYGTSFTKSRPFECAIMGAILHYLLLVQFVWMLIISYLQYKRFVEVIGAPITRIVLKSCLIAYSTPLIILIPTIITSSYTKAPTDICHPSGIALLLSVIIPITLVVTVNIVIFILILKQLYFARKIQKPQIRENLNILKVRLLVLLFFQLGIGWIFGILNDFWIGFTYMFIITTTTQGFVQFIILIIWQQSVRSMYFKNWQKVHTKMKTESTDKVDNNIKNTQNTKNETARETQDKELQSLYYQKKFLSELPSKQDDLLNRVFKQGNK